MSNTDESPASLSVRADKALQRFRLLCSQKTIHVACKRALEDQVRTTRRDYRREQARHASQVHGLRNYQDETRLASQISKILFEWKGGDSG
jgi:hypothetical protein